jgi:hypothetical protein
MEKIKKKHGRWGGKKNDPRKGGMRSKGGVVKNRKTGTRWRCAALELIFCAVERGIALP